MSKYRIIPFDKASQKDNFDCGVDDLNIYLKKYASQDIKRKIAQVFIICPSNSEEIIGFYTFSAFAIQTMNEIGSILLFPRKGTETLLLTKDSI
jgi:hypothetical protein